MRFLAELRSHWRSWLTLAVLAGVAGGFVVAAATGARRTDSALARHLGAYRFPDATVFAQTVDRGSLARLGALPQVQASALDAELAYCARDAKDRSVIDVGPQAVTFLVSLDGRDGVALHRPKLLAGRQPDPTRPSEALLDSRAAQRFGVGPGDVIPVRLFPSFEGSFAAFRCDPRDLSPSQPGLPTRRKVRQILIRCPKLRPCPEAKALINRLYAQLERGVDFAVLARKYSDDPAGKLVGGRLWIARGETVEPFDSTTFRLGTREISQPLKTQYGWHIVQPLSGLVPAGRIVSLKVVGVKATTDPFPLGSVLLTPAFDRAYRFDSLYFAYGMSVRLRRGPADIPAIRAALNRIGRRPRAALQGFEREQDAAAKIERSIHHQAQALRLAAAVGALLGFVLLAQALVRVASLAAVEDPTLRALGMTREQLVAAGVARAATIAMLAAAVAAAVAVALSPLSPIGLARELEPEPGFAFDPLAVALGAALVLVAVLLAGAYASSRSSREPAQAAPTGRVAPADTLARWGLPATVVSGVRLALARGRGATSVPVGATLLAGVLAISVVAIALTFTASLDHLFSTPRLYGQNWDYRSEYAVLDKTSARADRSLSDVARGDDKAHVLLNGRQVGAVAMDDIKGRIAPVVTEGRAPERTDEILLAPKTLHALGLKVGDTVEAQPLGIRRTVRMRIVGRGVVPEGTFNELGRGAALTFQAYKRFDPGAQAYTFEARIAPGADRKATLARLERRFVTPAPGPPKTVADFGGVDELPLVVSALLIAIAAAVLAHALVMAIRRRRRELAVLKTLGFDRRQVFATVAWQATTFAALGLVVGLPLGVSLGRWAWTLFAEQIGVVPEPVTPLPLILLVVPAAVLLANVVALLPARYAARTSPALVLRAE
jgi:PPIC-type PPIASE domain/FtsX-like permease family